MQKKILVSLLILFPSLFSDDLTDPIKILYLPQGHVHQDLTGKGFLGSTHSLISNINAGNPACIADFEGLNIGGSFQFESKIKEAWIADISHYRNNNLPQSFGLSYSHKNLYFALASNQSYNTKTDFGKIQGTMVWDNEQGYIDTEIFHPYKNETIYKNSAISAIKLNNILLESSILSIGFQFNSHFYTVLQSLGKNMLPDENGVIQIKLNDVKEKDIENNFSMGFRYSITDNWLNAKLGIFYESEIEFDKVHKYHGESYRYYKNIPQKLYAGFSITFPKEITITNHFCYVYWESIKGKNNTKDLLEWNGSITYELNSNLLVSIGSKITHTEYLDYGSDLIFQDKFFAHYFTAGCIYQYKDFEFDIALADSHLFSEEWRKHTIFKFGLGYHFNLTQYTI
ncbi:MAG: hypothetical protein JXQ65_13305 [Candidatus Marinimicrobia bacterium]|nr:hypothetical protein [Candidatus Neomarinimicrobiota bacterium]